MRAIPLALLALLVPGCSLPDPASAPEASQDACRDVAEASRNAPLLATLQEDPEQMAARLGEAMGTPVAGPPDPREDGRLVWRAGNATVTVLRGEDAARVAWERFEPWSPTREEADATLRRALDAFQPRDPASFVPHETNPGGDPHLLALQTHAGRPLHDAGVSLSSGAYASVTVFSLREIRPGVDVMEEARAVDLGTRAARCALDQEGLTEARGHRILGADAAGLGVRGASLALVVHVRVAEPDGESHCGHVQHVHVDAVTGKTLGVERPPCD